MNKLRNILLTGLLLLLLPLAALSGANSWTGTGPFATGLGNQVVNALALSPDGQTVYAGTGSGTVLSYEIVPAPTVTAISPTSGPIAGGTAVTITGTNLTGASAVTIGGAAATGVTVVDATTLTATTPSGSVGAQNVVVTTPGGSGTGTGLFTYVAVLAAPQMDLKQGVTSIADGGSHGFGSKMVSSNTDTVFTIENTGTGNLTVTTPISIGGANADQFSIQAQPVSPVSPSGSTTFTVRFTPTTAGAKTASISIANNDTTKNPYDVTLTGTGTSTTFSLSYDGNGQTSGSAPSDATAYASGASATVLGNTGSLVKTGNTFVGWNLASNASGTHYAVGASYTITSNTTLYAQWLGTPSATAASSVTLTGFTANWGSVAGATGYRLDVATDSGFGNMVAGFNDLDVGGLTSQALTGLPSGTTYHYRVRAYNGASSSASSNTISVTTGSSRIVTNTNDSGTGSLRKTISDANPGDTVTFAGGVTGTITLTAPLSITKDLTITGPGAAVVAVSGGNLESIFQIPGANSFTLQNLTLSNGFSVGGAALLNSADAITTISGCVFSGNSAMGGGAILSYGTLTISDSTFSGNSAPPVGGLYGGAIMTSGGIVGISNTLFSGNSAPAGGAIANGSTSMTLTNVTLSGNTANTGGGAIYASGGSTLNAVNTTIANNSTPGDGGGILAATGALVNLKNSIVASNTATTSGPDIAGTVNSQGYNLFGSTAGATIGGDTTGNLTNSAPMLGALANNGGATHTLALLSGSPAINTGTCTGAPAADQRGMARPQNSACDIGAYERGAPAALTATGGTPQTTPISTAFATALTASVVDSLGAALDGESITFAGPGSGASITAGGSVNSSTAGVASFSASANAVGGSYVVTASINALSASFNLTNSTSGNANLSALSLSSGTLTPVFAPGTVSYSAAVANAVTSITATPTVADSTASVKVNGVTVASGSASGSIALSVGANTITVLVTAQDASTKTYTVVVSRSSPPDTTPPTLSAVGVSGTTQTTTTLSATSDEMATGYWMVVARSATPPTPAQVKAGVAYAGVSVVAFGTDTMTAALAKTFAVGGLAAGTNYDLYVVAQDGSSNISTPPSLVPFTTQSVVLSSNANLSALVLSSGTLAPVFAPGTVSYSAAVANAVTSITATPTVADSTASVKVNGVTVASGSASGAIALNVGANTITVLVTAQDASTKTYTVVVTRASPPDTTAPTLSAVGVSGTTQTTTTLSATSDEMATGYWMVVARSATPPTPAQVKAGVAYAGVSVVAFGTDTMTAALAKTFAVGGLAAGTNYDLYVVAQDGSSNISTPPSLVPFTTQSVVLSSNANLSALVLSSGTLAPVFAPGTVSYSAAVGNAVASITVTPTVADSTASVKVNGVAVASGSASGSIALSVGANTITVLVTAQDASTKTYTVVVSRDSGPIDPPPGPFVPGLYPSIAGMSCLPTMLNVVGGDGPTLFADMLAVLSKAVETPLRYVGQTPTGAVVLTGFYGVDLAFVPIAFQSGDSRGDGVYAQAEGQHHIVSNGIALTVAPTLVRLDQFTSVLPIGTSVCMKDNGVLWAALGDTTYVVTPGIAVPHVDNPGPANLGVGGDGHYQFTDSLGNRQTLYPAFLEPYTLWTYLRMIDLSASMSLQLDGTVLARIHGVSYTLVPDLTLGGIAPEHADQSWWPDGPNRYRMRNQQRFNASQGFTVR